MLGTINLYLEHSGDIIGMCREHAQDRYCNAKHILDIFFTRNRSETETDGFQTHQIWEWDQPAGFLDPLVLVFVSLIFETFLWDVYKEKDTT